MVGKSAYRVFFVLLLVLAGNAPAAELQWDNSSDDSLWRTEQNWSPNHGIFCVGIAPLFA